MEFVSSLTGKSPSTTGFGSEGALTKGPFNALWPVVDLNNALVSAILTGYAGFTTSAGYVGPQVRVDHDISMLVPEIWCRMRVHERDPQFMISEGLLERVEDFQLRWPHDSREPPGLPHHPLLCRPLSRAALRDAGRCVPRRNAAAGKTGSGIVCRGRGCHRGSAAARGAELFRGWQRRGRLPAAEGAAAHHGAWRHSKEWSLDDPRFRALFDRDAVLGSDWYRERLRVKQKRDIALWKRHVAALRNFSKTQPMPTTQEFDVEERTRAARAQLARVSTPAYLDELRGTIGADPLLRPVATADSTERT